ncbi:MAG: dickkopf-related protein [Candidatus Anstonellales archaeon]
MNISSHLPLFLLVFSFVLLSFVEAAQYECQISPSSASMEFGSSLDFQVTCNGQSCGLKTYMLDLPSFLKKTYSSPDGFGITTSSTAEGGDGGRIYFSGANNQGDKFQCSAEILIEDKHKTECIIPTINAPGTAAVNLVCFDNHLPNQCSETLLSPFSWIVSPDSSGVSITFRDPYYSSATITADESAVNKKVEVVGRDKDNNLFSCYTAILPLYKKSEKCLIFPKSYILSPPSITYSATCMDTITNLLRPCSKTHTFKAFGYSQSSFSELTLPLLRQGKEPNAGYLLVSDDQECSSYFHSLIFNPVLPPKEPLSLQCTKDSDCPPNNICIGGNCVYITKSSCTLKLVKSFSHTDRGSSAPSPFLGSLIEIRDKLYLVNVGWISVIDISHPDDPQFMKQTATLNACGDVDFLRPVGTGGGEYFEGDDKLIVPTTCLHYQVWDIDNPSLSHCFGVSKSLRNVYYRAILVSSQGNRYHLHPQCRIQTPNGNVYGICYTRINDEDLIAAKTGEFEEYCSTDSKSMPDFVPWLDHSAYVFESFKHNGRSYLALNTGSIYSEKGSFLEVYDVTDFPNNVIKVFERDVVGNDIEFYGGKLYVLSLKESVDPLCYENKTPRPPYRCPSDIDLGKGGLFVYDLNTNELVGKYTPSPEDPEVFYGSASSYVFDQLKVDGRYAYVSSFSRYDPDLNRYVTESLGIIDLTTMKPVKSISGLYDSNYQGDYLAPIGWIHIQKAGQKTYLYLNGGTGFPAGEFLVYSVECK